VIRKAAFQQVGGFDTTWRHAKTWICLCGWSRPVTGWSRPIDFAVCTWDPATLKALFLGELRRGC
jgi:hypothetical protein